MSREAKKRPGDAEKARVRHLRRQQIQAAISAVARGETVALTFYRHPTLGDCTWDLYPEDPTENWEGALFLVYTGKNHLHIGRIFEKDGQKIWCGGGWSLRLDAAKILAQARPTNEAARNWV